MSICAILFVEVAPVRVEQVRRLQEEVDQLRNENAMLRERKDNLEIQMEGALIGQDTVQGRILHPAKNPLAEFLLQRENEKEKLSEEV